VENYLYKRKSLKRNNNKKRHLLVFQSLGLMLKNLNLEMELGYLPIQQFLHLIKVKEYFQRIIYLVKVHLEIIKNKMNLKPKPLILYLELLKVFSLLILEYLLLKNKHLYSELLNQMKLKEEKMEKKVIVNKFN
jgi:hypothetical protein